MQKVEENKNIQQRNIKALGRELWRPVLLLSFLVVALVLAQVFGLVGRLVELQDWIKGEKMLLNFLKQEQVEWQLLK